jgi:hypothetical protein
VAAWASPQIATRSVSIVLGTGSELGF